MPDGEGIHQIILLADEILPGKMKNNILTGLCG